MPEIIENYIQSLLDGHSLDVDSIYNAAHLPQVEANGTKGNSAALSNYVPVCQKTVTFIVAAVVLNDQGEVLMMQEAKASCAGKWYLPAGRVERNENLVEAVKREVLEETGLILQPLTLLMVECASGSWYRFVFTGEITGGTIKTVDQANEESLQACWIGNVDTLSLRSNDIVPLIERVKNYTINKSLPRHPYLMSVPKSLSKLLLRLLITAKKRATNKLHVLASDTEPYALPICEINPQRSLLSTLHSFMAEIFGSGVAQHKPHGLLSVEFSGGQGGDGLCLTLLVSFKLPLEDISIVENYMWVEMSENVARSVTSRLPRDMTVPLHVVR